MGEKQTKTMNIKAMKSCFPYTNNFCPHTHTHTRAQNTQVFSHCEKKKKKESSFEQAQCCALVLGFARVHVYTCVCVCVCVCVWSRTHALGVVLVRREGRVGRGGGGERIAQTYTHVCKSVQNRSQGTKP